MYNLRLIMYKCRGNSLDFFSKQTRIDKDMSSANDLEELAIIAIQEGSNHLQTYEIITKLTEKKRRIDIIL